MKRMVKNGDLIDVEPDGTITVAGKPIGGGGSNDREITLTMPYTSTSVDSEKKLYLDEETWNNIKNLYYETVKLYYNDGKPIGIFHVFKYEDSWYGIENNGYYASISFRKSVPQYNAWYGTYVRTFNFASIALESDSTGKFIHLKSEGGGDIPQLKQSNFDALYKLADKPTQDGTYVLKATVSGGTVTYTWAAQ